MTFKKCLKNWNIKAFFDNYFKNRFLFSIIKKMENSFLFLKTENIVFLENIFLFSLVLKNIYTNIKND